MCLMADGRVTWQPVSTEFPEGTSPADHYTVHLGTMTADEPLGTTQHIFSGLTPGEYPSSVETIAQDGTVLAMHQGNVLHVPTPVMVPVAMQVQAALVP
jgi:hypothetical protein